MDPDVWDHPLQSHSIWVEASQRHWLGRCFYLQGSPADRSSKCGFRGTAPSPDPLQSSPQGLGLGIPLFKPALKACLLPLQFEKSASWRKALLGFLAGVCPRSFLCFCFSSFVSIITTATQVHCNQLGKSGLLFLSN